MTQEPTPKQIWCRSEAETFLALFDAAGFVKLLQDEAPDVWSAFLEQESQHGWIKSETGLEVDKKLHRFLGQDKVKFGSNAMRVAFGAVRDYVRENFRMKYANLCDYPDEESDAWLRDIGHDPR
ncbi:hypothetical+protein [Methylocapsa aurea]|uniref:hypothetical protein n=1 Tax=Methylocapsa aurea TaxID=663610 RepID=UPI003D18DB5A